MPAIELMSWIASQRRWMKNYRGRRYAVSPHQLHTAATKEASRVAANAWWTKNMVIPLTPPPPTSSAASGRSVSRGFSHAGGNSLHCASSQPSCENARKSRTGCGTSIRAWRTIRGQSWNWRSDSIRKRSVERICSSFGGRRDFFVRVARTAAVGLRREAGSSATVVVTKRRPLRERSFRTRISPCGCGFGPFGT